MSDSTVASAAYSIAIFVTIDPGSAGLLASQSRQFTSTVTGTANTSVSWSVNPSGTGAITSNGIYTAPVTIAATTTVAVTATSSADPSKSATAVIVLSQSGNGNVTGLAPSSLKMVVGDTHRIQALDANGGQVVGLSWLSSDPTVLSLSTDDPPVLTALAPGQVTIYGGSVSTNVTVLASTPATGTVMWSVAGNGSGVNSILPAIPSATGAADVFAFQGDGTVWAIVKDGTLAWAANVGFPQNTLADFQGGLVIWANDGSIYKLDGMSGQAEPAFVTSDTVLRLGVHRDGTIFAVTRHDTESQPVVSVLGIDPSTGTQKFSVTVNLLAGLGADGALGPLMIAGDGYAYLPYATRDENVDAFTIHISLLRVDNTGASDVIPVQDWSTLPDYFEIFPFSPGLISNADTGVVLTLATDAFYIATTTGTNVSVVNTPLFPNQNTFSPYIPVLQAEDGSFIGTVVDNQSSQFMVGFGASGNLLWSVPSETPRIALHGGGVVGTSGTTYDSSGNMTGQIPNLAALAWNGDGYQIGSVDWILIDPVLYAGTWVAFQGGTQSANGTTGIPMDSTTDKAVKDILSPKMWDNFRLHSHCAAVLFAEQGFQQIMNFAFSAYGLQQKFERTTHFYNVNDPTYANYSLKQLTGGEVQFEGPISGRLGNADAGAFNWGAEKHSVVLLKQAVFQQSTPAVPKYTLVHELLHAYTAAGDDAIYANTYFKSNGLHRGNGNETLTLSGWLSTDCHCTPGQTQNCSANSAPTW
jgi:hypothetical protein